MSYQLTREGAQELRVPFASHAWFSRALRDCAAQGWAPRGGMTDDNPFVALGHPVQTDLFGYIPSVENQGVTGRLVRLHFPKLAGLDGDLAVRMAATAGGEVIGKELLFSSNPELGQVVLDNLEASLEIAKPGKGRGPFISILSMKFQNGELAVLLQTHHQPNQG